MRLALKYLGYVLLISVIFRIIPIVTAIIYKESIINFIMSSLISIAIGTILITIPKKDDESISFRDGLILTALSFITIPLISSFSFIEMFRGNIINAIFESFSGFTTTGLTMTTSLAGIPKSTLLWRAETQWIGGLGIVMVFLFMMSKMLGVNSEVRGKSLSALYQTQGLEQKLEPTIKKSMNRIILIYLTYSVAGMILLAFAGLPLIEAVSMMFTSISTGGFSFSDQIYTNTAQLVIISLLMIIGSTSFLTHNRLFRLKIKEFFSSSQVRLSLVIFAFFIVTSLFTRGNTFTNFFHLLSAMTTTGYSLQEAHLFSPTMLFLIIVSMIIGGSLGSTSGGIKLFRFGMILKAIPWVMKKLSSPLRAIIPLKHEGKPVEEKNLTMIEIFVSTYMIILGASILIFISLGLTITDSAFIVTSALGTVGLQSTPLVSIPIIGKLLLIALMVLGRLEIFPLLVLARSVVKRN